MSSESIAIEFDSIPSLAEELNDCLEPGEDAILADLILTDPEKFISSRLEYDTALTRVLEEGEEYYLEDLPITVQNITDIVTHRNVKDIGYNLAISSPDLALALLEELTYWKGKRI